MVTLEEWFETKDYGIGLAILGKHCKNRAMLQVLGRKPNPDKLEYELRKLATAQHVHVEPEHKPVPKNKPAKESHSDQVINQMNLDEQTTGKNIIRAGRILSPDELPPEIKKLWQQNRDDYKLIRSLHEKLKLMAKSPAKDRKFLVNQIVTLDATIKCNWEKIDAWDPNNPVPEKKAEPIDHKRINANRKLICTNLKSIQIATSTEKADEIRRKLQERFDELRNAGEELDPETIERLSNVGVK